LTTGQVARICQVAPRTVSKWFDRGQLRGYRIPGSRDRRIPVDRLVAFMRANGIPLTGLDGGISRVLVIGDCAPEDAEPSADERAGGPGAVFSGRAYGRKGLEIRLAANGFEAGVVAQQFRPHAVALPVGEDAAEAIGICRNIKASESFGEAWVIAVCRDQDAAGRRQLLSQGFDACISRAYAIADLLEAMDKLSAETTHDKGRSWRA
jgi:excisionase family DNA binding protein